MPQKHDLGFGRGPHGHVCSVDMSCIASPPARGATAYTQGKLFGYMSVAWGLGTTIGPLIGGSLAQPCDNKPSMSLCEPGELFYERCVVHP